MGKQDFTVFIRWLQRQDDSYACGIDDDGYDLFLVLIRGVYHYSTYGHPLTLRLHHPTQYDRRQSLLTLMKRDVERYHEDDGS